MHTFFILEEVTFSSMQKIANNLKTWIAILPKFKVTSSNKKKLHCAFQYANSRTVNVSVYYTRIKIYLELFYNINKFYVEFREFSYFWRS